MADTPADAGTRGDGRGEGCDGTGKKGIVWRRRERIPSVRQKKGRMERHIEELRARQLTSRLKWHARYLERGNYLLWREMGHLLEGSRRVDR
jgi:hypothetical protein